MKSYATLLRPKALRTLLRMRADLGEALYGSTPEEDLTLISGILVASRARRVLQLGTFLGFSSVVIADVIASAKHAWRFVSVDPDPEHIAIARKYTDMAGLDRCEYWLGRSESPDVVSRAAAEAWDAIYVDTTHQYAQTRIEIESYTAIAAPGTILLFHDASTDAQQLDVEGRGGVKRALREFVEERPEWQLTICERPAFRGLFGVGVLTRKA